MADDILNEKEIENLINQGKGKEAYDLLTKSVDSLKGAIKEGRDVGASFEDILKKINELGPKVGKSLNYTSDKTNNLTGSFIEGLKVANAFFHVIGSGSTVFEQIGRSASDATATINSKFSNIDILGSGGKKIKEQLLNFFKPAAGSGGIIGSLGDLAAKGGKTFLEGLDRISESADRVGKMRSAFVGMQAAVGDLGDVFDNSGQIAESFDRRIQKINNDIVQATIATGLDSAEIAKYFQQMGKGIPDSLTTSVQTSKGAVSEFYAAVDIAAATGKNLQNVINDLEGAYSNFNLTGQKAIDFISSIASVSSDLKTPLGATEQSIKHMAEQFAYLGDNTGGAVRAFGQFVPALRDAGLSPQQAINIFNDMTASISGMTTASKAFLAQRSGLGGGLQGAFKIDNLIAQGKSDEVLNMAVKNLQKQFGKTVTLEQAGQSQAAANQYQRQLKYLESTAFGSLIKNEKQAAAFFKAMQSGSITKQMANNILTGEDATKKITARGEAIREKTENPLNKLLRPAIAETEAMGMENDFKATETLNNLLNGYGKSNLGKDLSSLKTDVARETSNVVNRYSDPSTGYSDIKDGIVRYMDSVIGGTFGKKDAAGNTVKEQPKSPPSRAPQSPELQKTLQQNFQKTTTTIPAQASAITRPLTAADRIGIAIGKIPDSNAKKDTTVKTATASNDTVVRRAVDQNMRNTTAQSAIPIKNIQTAATAAPQPVVAKLETTNLNITGQLKVTCVHCNQEMESANLENAKIAAVEEASNANRQSVGSSARRI